MNFLKANDFDMVASSDEMQALQESNESALDKAEKAALSYFKGYLRSRYNIDAEFAKVDDLRDDTLIIMLCDWTIWTLLSNEPDRFISDTRVERKTDVLAWLMRCQNGTIDPGFDDLVDEDGVDQGTGIKHGSNTKSSYDW